ncbi:hypothetical protein UFOVP191_60 [uncultured Caudovirales phage]|uniref:Uncharacterized protein n=1 Tax=uncultured Caudovirales phage TaxID=2100421 RepID=A0A6J7WN77_9CAUD|nr:hypothetical protein UFOVP191_60 [uncultured Caudovirales phage]
MANITHTFINPTTDWTQTDVDAAIARGELPAGTLAANMTKPSDWNAAHTVSNIVNADIGAAAAIDASKIADGSVSSAEFQYINSLTSNAQTQINGKQGTITLTTTGSSGAATLIADTLNIPQYAGGGSTAFSAITSATNTTAAMVVGTGASMAATGSGTIAATSCTNATLTTALTVNTGTVTLTGNAANTSVLTIGAGAVSVSGANTGDQTITLTGAVTGTGTGSFATTIATPGTLTVASTNSTATAHTHAITSSSAPGAAASLLATDASGIIGSTGTRIVKGWFTDLTVTNNIAGSITGNAATVTTNANLTGVITSVGNATSIASQTGTGTKFVVDTSPTLVTPVLGVAAATSVDVGTNATPGAGGYFKAVQTSVTEAYLRNDGVYMKNIYVGGGWARNLLGYADSADAQYMAFGGYGTGQTFTRGWIGSTYDTPWIDFNATTTGFYRPSAATANPTSATKNFTMWGGATSPVLGAATADAVSLAPVDKAAGDRRLYIQSESGSAISLGNDRLNFAAATGIISMGDTTAMTLSTSAASFAGTVTLATPVITGLPTGSGVASAATASTLASRDANGNLTAANHIEGYTTTATAAGTTTLTVSSNFQQFFTGSTTQTVTLPVTSTLVLGQQYNIVNNSTDTVTVNSSGGNAVIVLAGNTAAIITCILTSGTTAASWSVTLDSSGVTTNSNAAAGAIGETITTMGIAAAATVTISNASPCVISDTAAVANTGSPAAGITVGSVINFTTTGALPTGLSTGTNYYVISTGFTAGASYQISATPGGTAINTSSAGSGTHTRINNAILTNNTAQNIAVITLTAGDWDLSGNSNLSTTGVTTLMQSMISPSSNSLTGYYATSYGVDATSVTAENKGITNGRTFLKLSGTTTFYLVAYNSFTTGSSAGTGCITARRMR